MYSQIMGMTLTAHQLIVLLMIGLALCATPWLLLWKDIDWPVDMVGAMYGD